jgi:hypothetical protein
MVDRSLRARLGSLLAGAARAMSVGQLRRQGYQKVRVLGRDQLYRIVEQAVEFTLNDLGLGEPGLPGRLGPLVRTRFEALLQDVKRLELERESAKKEGEELESKVNELRRKIHLAAEELEVVRTERRTLEALRPPADREAMRAHLRTFLRTTYASYEQIEKAIEAVDGFLDAETRRIEGVVAARASDDSAVLQRRLEKLQAALAKAEADLAQSGVPVFPGIASIYRTLQGLSREEAQYDRKRALLQSIFEANVRLRKAIEAS